VSLDIPLVWNPAHARHEPGGEVYVGVRTPGTELPARAERIREAVEGAGAAVVDAGRHPETALTAVHSPELLEYLEGAWAAWQGAGLDTDPGQERVVPYLFPHPGLLGELHPADPRAAAARAGAFAFDTMTLIGPGTWEAARGAADAALTAVDLVADGERAAYACCRPPGHHVARRTFGGSCYLNNAAIAVAALRARVGARVALLDVDAHHGNGAQAIFWRDAEVLTGSVHVDPGAGWFPHFLGFASEHGGGLGEGANLNLPLPPGTDDEAWLGAVRRLAEWARAGGAQGLVVALGVDAAAGDPESPLAVTAEGYREAAGILCELGLPTVIVQEGGYDLDSIGPLVLSFLEGFA
jgi:acetoin utilization deacetylase AcuC-like enzyme